MQPSNVLSAFASNLVKDQVDLVKTSQNLFVRFEGVVNILGFIADVSCYSGQVRIVVGAIQVIVFGSGGIYHWIRATFQEAGELQNYHNGYSDYCREIVTHGFGNVTRGFIEIWTPLGNWIVIAYTIAGERMRYSFEVEIVPNNRL